MMARVSVEVRALVVAAIVFVVVVLIGLTFQSIACAKDGGSLTWVRARRQLQCVVPPPAEGGVR